MMRKRKTEPELIGPDEPLPGSGGGIGGIFANMFGLGPVFKMMGDPGFQASMSAAMAAMPAAMQAMAADAQRVARIEAKLDVLLSREGIDVDEFNKQFAEFAGALRRGPSPVPPGDGAAGRSGDLSASTEPRHNGVGGAPLAASAGGHSAASDDAGIVG